MADQFPSCLLANTRVVVLQSVKGFVFDLPSRSSTSNEFLNCRCVHLQLRNPTKTFRDLLIGIELHALDERDLLTTNSFEVADPKTQNMTVPPRRYQRDRGRQKPAEQSSAG